MTQQMYKYSVPQKQKANSSVTQWIMPNWQESRPPPFFQDNTVSANDVTVLW